MSELSVQDHSAKYYEENRYKNLGLAYHKRVIKSMIPIRAMGGGVLDVGCGTGIVSRIFPNSHIVGVDISEEMLKYHPGFCQKASADKLPFDDNSFDTVVCRSLLHHLPHPSLALQEMRRVLRKGGMVFFWETNKSALAEFIRGKTQHGDRFSEYHTSFDNLPQLVSNFFDVVNVKYEGFLAYPLFGFPDIINFTKFMPFKEALFKLFISLDEMLSNSPFNKMAFAVRVIAEK